jgi:hypothetical protein
MTDADHLRNISSDTAARYPIVQPPEHDEVSLLGDEPSDLVRTCLCGQEFTGSTAHEAQARVWEHVDAAS